MKRLWLMLAMLALCAGPARSSPDDVRVRLFSLRAPTSLRLESAVGGQLRLGAAIVRWRPGTVVRLSAGASGVAVSVGGAPAVVVEAVTAQAPDMRLGGRHFGGAVTVRAPRARSLHVVASVPLETYVAGVAGAEALAQTPREAMRAQAVAARSYAVALARLDRPRDRLFGPHADEGYDFCDITHCQVFRDATPESADAAHATRGRVLVCEGRVVATWYHSTCGGRTVDGTEAGADPALRGTVDAPANGRAWCAASPHFRWNADLSREEMREALAADALLPLAAPLCAVRVTACLPGGRVRTAEIEGDAVRSVTGLALWQALGAALGWGRVESAWFTIKSTRAGFHLEGRGLGHGVGLCQYGSVAMARAGRSMSQILTHYYGGTHLR